MSQAKWGQVTQSAAEIYEELFVPALFREWAPRVADAARIAPGERVADVACGTGVLAREAARRVGPARSVVGLDLNEGMLAVARRLAPEIDWRQGRAEALPFEDESFDAVISQFGLMFFDDRPKAITEMARVLRPAGRLAVAVWDSLENSPGFAAVTELLQGLFGDPVADGLCRPFELGDVQVLSSLFSGDALSRARVKTVQGSARFPSIRSWLFTEARGWTLSGMIDDEQFERLIAEGEPALREFRAADGTVVFDAPAHIVTATKSASGRMSAATR